MGIWANLKHFFENKFLHGSIVYSDGTSANFHSVQNEIVMLTTDLFGEFTMTKHREQETSYKAKIASYEIANIFTHRRGKGMMGAAPAAASKKFLVGIGTSEKRKFCDPKEARFTSPL